MLLITHDERFHFDDVLATAVLLKIYPDAKVVRTRDMNIIITGDIVYDVGGVFDPNKNRFDHHMSTFTETYSPMFSIKLSSSGLVYKYYHEALLKTYGVSEGTDNDLYNSLILKIYKKYFLPADAIDNGVDIYGEIKPYTIYDLVNNLNYSEDLISDSQTNQFNKAVEIVSMDLDNFINKILNTWYHKYKEVESLLSGHNDYILVHETHINPSLILDVEEKLGKNIVYLIFPSAGKYKIRAINKGKCTFESKVPLLEEWRGKREDELKDVIEGAYFVHMSGFIGINYTLEGAINMCRKSYEAYKKAK